MENMKHFHLIFIHFIDFDIESILLSFVES